MDISTDIKISNFLSRRSKGMIVNIYISSQILWLLVMDRFQLPSRLFLSQSFFLQRLLFIVINIPHGLVWNTVVMSGHVPLTVTYICQINCRIRSVVDCWSFTCYLYCTFSVLSKFSQTKVFSVIQVRLCQIFI